MLEHKDHVTHRDSEEANEAEDCCKTHGQAGDPEAEHGSEHEKKKCEKRDEREAKLAVCKQKEEEDNSKCGYHCMDNRSQVLLVEFRFASYLVISSFRE